jgi:3'-phosphoadenosine 5'-phosphosulfate sulfotransferase (PAPS reductase)/FAD synthetase
LSSPRANRFLSTDSKVDIANVVIREALMAFKKPAVLFQADAPSAVLMHLIKTKRESELLGMLPAIFVDHGEHPKETSEMTRELSKRWNFPVILAKNEDVISHIGGDGRILVGQLNQKNKNALVSLGFAGEYLDPSPEVGAGKYLLRNIPLHDVVDRYRLDAIFIAPMLDAVSDELIRNDIANDKPELIEPLIDFCEQDIWKYVIKYEVPRHPLYLQGYRTFYSKSSCSKSESPPWQKFLEQDDHNEIDKSDEKEIEEKLKRLGYL